MHDCNKQLKSHKKETHAKNPICNTNIFDCNHQTGNDNKLLNLKHLLQLNNTEDAEIEGMEKDTMDGVDDTAAVTATAAAPTVQEIQNLQLTQWWFLIMQQTIFNFKTTIQQHQQVKHSKSKIPNQGAAALSSVADPSNHFDLFKFINAVDNN